MTTFKEQMTNDLSAVFYNSDEFAFDAIYTPVKWAPGDPETVSCSIHIDHDVLVQAEGYDAGVRTMGTTISAQVVDVGTVNKGDTFKVAGTTYTAQRVDRYSEDGLEVTVVVK